MTPPALARAVGALGIVVSLAPGLRAAAAESPKRRPVPRTPSATTFMGPFGVESSAILAENRKRGTTAWRITTTPRTGTIEGFAGTTDAAAGDRVRLFVSTTARTFRVIAYRMGWYGGDGARQVWSSRTVRGRVQPPCRLVASVNMVTCDDWSVSLRVPVTRRFPPGDYLLKLVGSGGEESYVLLTVSDPKSSAAYVLMARSMTEEGWNTFGGYDLYEGEGPCPPGSATYPPCNRARVVSFDRPYATGDGAADFLGDELPLVELVERHGLDVTYVTDVAVSEHPGLLLHHRAILSLGHDETWTAPELLGVEAAIRHGVNVAFLSAAAIVRHARFEPSPLGPDREVVDYRDAAEDPLDGKASPLQVTGNTWASPPTDVATTKITGELYSGFVEPGAAPVPFVVYDPSAFIFRGTGLKRGSAIPGVIASDIDHVAPAWPMPGDLQVLGHSPVPLAVAYTNQGSWDGRTYADMTYYTDPTTKAGVLDTGTVNWIAALAPCGGGGLSCPAPLLGRIMGNLLHLFGRGPAGRYEPSVANWRQVAPPGS